MGEGGVDLAKCQQIYIPVAALSNLFLRQLPFLVTVKFIPPPLKRKFSLLMLF
jgi:hypothetical protein